MPFLFRLRERERDLDGGKVVGDGVGRGGGVAFTLRVPELTPGDNVHVCLNIHSRRSGITPEMS